MPRIREGSCWPETNEGRALLYVPGVGHCPTYILLKNNKNSENKKIEEKENKE